MGELLEHDTIREKKGYGNRDGGKWKWKFKWASRVASVKELP